MRGLTVLAAACALACAAPAAAAPPAEVVPGEVVVAFAPDAAAAQRARAMAMVDADGSRVLGSTGIRVVELGGGESVAAAVRELERLPGVRYAEPNYVVRAALTPNDPLFGDGTLFGLLRIGAPAAWDVTTGSGVVVGVADSGVQASHPDLAANMLPGFDFVGPGGADPSAYAAHGTHVAGTVAAVGGNGLGVAGVAFGARVQPLQVLDGHGSGTTADLAEALAYAGTAGIRVVNASLTSTAPSAAVLDAIALSPKTLFVVAAGNGGADDDLTPAYPCSFAASNIVCVAATDSLDRLASFSNFGHFSVDLAAPGDGIVSTLPALTDVLQEEFEGGALPSGWTVESGGWAVGDAGLGGALFDIPPGGAAYASSVISPAVAVPVNSECALRAEGALQTDGAGSLVFEVGASAAGPWTRVGELTGPYTSLFGQESETFRTGAAAAWHGRLRFAAGASVSAGDGVEVTRFGVRCVTGSTYGASSGTSMAAPHVAGAAALMLSRNPALAPADLRDALVQSAAPVSDLVGKVVAAGRLDLPRALALRLAPIVTTGDSSSDAAAGGVLRGTVNPRGEATTYHFEYGPTPAYGSRTPDVTMPAASGDQQVSASVGGLALGTMYHLRLVATSAGGTVNGADAVVSTVADLTNPITRIRLPACPKPFKKATCKRFRSRAKAWKVLAGTVSDRKPSSGIARVEVAVTADRVGKVCRGFDGRRLIRLRCGSRRWVPARLAAAGWSLRLGALPDGRYQVRVRGRDGAKNVEQPKAGRNTLGFTIERR